MNAATLQPSISPGQVVSIFGSNLGTAPITPQYDSAGLYPTDVSHNTNYDGTQVRDGVTFNGVPAALVYVSPTQINAQVPYGVAGLKTANVVVTRNLVKSPAFPVTIQDTSPGIYTVNQTGNGQGAILNSHLGITSGNNNADNPAEKGSAISIFATGAGLWAQPVQDGSIMLAPSSPGSGPALAAPVSVTIGGQPATVIYAGAAPFLISGVVQVNAIVPQEIGSGPQPVVLTIGGNSNAGQQVTVAVQ